MTSELERKIAYWRCQNKPVIFIAKTLKIPCDDVRKVLFSWKKRTQGYLDSLEAKTVLLNPDIRGLLHSTDLTSDYAVKLLSNENVVNYMVLNRNEKHNRYMDCLRYHILLVQG
ncbi:hypothetical protein [Sulfuracidifex tepidarius]|uniref:Uncharacterized protein n=1 Tax=Sulfuracidifex tepidarius TaxID=1294262 RepID=A0A510DVB2_9CREN|nr:hypothetical protein [Sulfuracidifex tepidarius]BBG24151.1 hypothetical protein IC006_1455 [Sulfuracidifex tepidarius]BBG26908.1 hypothetical protein IC007_1432 [Sulfuracidifex tepidarius]